MEENSNNSEKSKSVPTNFSIERILLKSDNNNCESNLNLNKSKPLNKVTPNPWLSITPISFKPKVVIQQPPLKIEPSPSSSGPSPSVISPTPHQMFPQLNPLYTSFFQQFPSASSFFYNDQYREKLLSTVPGFQTNNNNLISVNNYNYFFENHLKQVQNMTANISNAYNRSQSASPLLSLSSSSQLINLNNNLSNVDKNTENLKKFFLMNNIGHNEESRDGSASSSLIDDSINKLDDGLKCVICNKMFGCTEILEWKLFTFQAHEKSHRSPRYECDECGKGFSQLRNFKYHVSVHRGTKEFAAKCPECGKVFNDKGYLSSHMKIHRNKKEYKCPHCVKSFNQRVAYNMHIRIHTGVKPHKCDQCNKRFSRKMLLKQHARTHSGEKPYQCTVCGKTFADRSNMTLHHRLHSGVKPFACPICPKAFTKKHHLKTHINYHTGYKPYKCPHENCGQTFTQSSNMRTHAKKCQFKKPD
uniref:CSON006272 protein n=1 Tax=Culicoides sonorensis TaxID=179676 RepID=A0A336MUY6_CULSO